MADPMKITIDTYRLTKLNVFVADQIVTVLGSYEYFVFTIKIRQLGWFAQISRHANLAKNHYARLGREQQNIGRSKRIWMKHSHDSSRI